MPLLIKPKQTVLFTGDSITDAGRRGPEAPMGNGYARMAADLIVARHPDHANTFLNTGISGNTVRDLTDRWSDDVIRHQPDWVSLMIGINDLNRWLRQIPDQSVSPDEFADLYPPLLERVRDETKAKLILIDPFYISLDQCPDSFRALVLKHLPAYQKTVHAAVKKHKAVHVKMHDLFQRQLQHHPVDRFAPEPVHPNPSGHLLMAHAWLQALGW
jgi:lysophospholipase L1-like esterase